MFKFNHPKELLASQLVYKYLYEFDGKPVRQAIYGTTFNKDTHEIELLLDNNTKIILKDEPFIILPDAIPEVDWNDPNVVQKKFPNYGDLFTVQEFYEMVECGGIIDSDGSGELSNGTQVAWGWHPVKVLASAIYSNSVTHIMWYNK